MHIISFIDEIGSERIELPGSGAKAKCQVFEDNDAARVIATVSKIRPQTNYINIKYWHFVEYIEQNKMDIQLVQSQDQPADILTLMHAISIEFEKGSSAR